KNPKESAYVPGRGVHEDILYFWESVAREFVDVLRSYSFQDYKSLKFQLSQGGKTLTWTATREDLELFRRHKKSFRDILILASDNA
ncbi:MAG: hypothetical protein WCJ71_10880, partial [Candidatus Omnitrophota bacterium]